MARVNQVNFGSQLFQPITQQQTPKSILAQLLLQSGFRRDRTAGSGIRSAGELIAGALLQKSAFGEREEKSQAKAKAQGELIKSLFSKPDVLSRGPDQPAEATNFGASGPGTGPLTGDVAPDPIPEFTDQSGNRQSLAPSQPEVNFAQLQPGFSSGPALQPPPDIPGQVTSTPGGLNQTGALLQGLLKAQGGGPLNQGLIPQLALQQQQFKRADTQAASEAQAKITAAKQKQIDAIALRQTRSGDFQKKIPPRITKSNIIDGKIIVPTAEGGFEAIEVINLGEGAKGQEVKRSDILEDGSAVLVFKDGSTGVRDRQGNVITGEDRVRVLNKSLRFSLDKTRLKAGEKQAGAEAIKLSTDMFKQSSTIEQGIGLYDEAVAKVQAGAGTGPIISMFPSVRDASIGLDNIQAQLGLNVVARTTFGSLSEAELTFALSSALPTRLDEPALIEWITNKKSAQQKLANYLQSAAVFLGTPGNTVADWATVQKKAQAERAKDTRGTESKIGRFTVREK